MGKCNICERCGRAQDCSSEPLCELCEADIQGFLELEGKQSLRRCDTFGCSNTADRMVTIAAGTTIWLCFPCSYLEDKSVTPSKNN